MGAGKQLHGYYTAGGVWLPVKVDASGRLAVDASLLFEDSPTDGELKKGPTSNWAFGHNALPTHKNIGARVYCSSYVTVYSGSGATISFNLEHWDTDTIHNNTTNPSRLTCKTAGKYLVIGQFGWDTNAGGSRRLYIYRNGTHYLVGQTALPLPSIATILMVSTICDLAVNDYVEMNTFQDSGSTLYSYVTPDAYPEFMMQRLG